MNEHYHTAIDHIVITVIVVAVGFHVARMGAGVLAKSSNPTLATVGKAVGGVFTFA